MGTAIIIIIFSYFVSMQVTAIVKNCAMAVAAAENMMPWKQK